MDSDQPPSTGRKVKFAPKAPPRTRSKTRAAAQLKSKEADDSAKAQQLLRHFNDSIRRKRAKVENKSAVQATFIYGPKQSAATKASTVPQQGSHRESSRLELKHLDDDGEQLVIPFSFTDEPSEIKMSSDSEHDSCQKTKDYREPWDYAHTYYPTALPWRKPYTGDPDVLNEDEFGEASRKLEYDENAINPASELGFLDLDEASENSRLLFLQLPPSLPLIKRSASTKGKEKEGMSAAPDQRATIASVVGGKGSSIRVASQRLCSLEELPAGKMGKILVYQSGAVKLKLGDVLYDVSPGSHCAAARDVLALNIKEKECYAVGELHTRAFVTPSIEHLLDSVIDLT